MRTGSTRYRNRWSPRRLCSPGAIQTRRARKMTAVITTTVPASEAGAGEVPNKSQPNNSPNTGAGHRDRGCTRGSRSGQSFRERDLAGQRGGVNQNVSRDLEAGPGDGGSSGVHRRNERQWDCRERKPHEDGQRVLGFCELAHRHVGQSRQHRPRKAYQRRAAQMSRGADNQRHTAQRDQNERPMPAPGRLAQEKRGNRRDEDGVAVLKKHRIAQREVLHRPEVARQGPVTQEAAQQEHRGVVSEDRHSLPAREGDEGRRHQNAPRKDDRLHRRGGEELLGNRRHQGEAGRRDDHQDQAEAIAGAAGLFLEGGPYVRQAGEQERFRVAEQSQGRPLVEGGS